MLGHTFYADLPARRLRQVIGDALVVLWVVGWVFVGREIHDRATSQGQGAQQLERAGGDFAESMSDAGGKLGKVPVIGEDIQQPFDKASAAGSDVARAGNDIQIGADQLGQLLGVLSAALAIGLVLVVWGQTRWRYAHKVRAARALEGVEGAQVKAVRAALGLDHATLGLRARDEVSTSSTDVGSSTDEGDEVSPEDPPAPR